MSSAVGANSVDFVYRVPAPPQIQGPFAKMRIGRHLISCGGQATTMLATIAAMGLRGKYVGVTGNDDNGARIRRELTLLGLDIERTSSSATSPIRTRSSWWTTSSGERMVLWNREDDLSMRAEEYPLDLVALGPRRPRRRHRSGRVHRRRAGGARKAGVPVTSDIDRLTDLTEAADCRGQPADVRRARAGGADRRSRISSARCGSCAARTTGCCASRSGRAARCCSTATGSTASRPRWSTQSTRPAPGDVFRGGVRLRLAQGRVPVGHPALRQRRRRHELHPDGRDHRRADARRRAARTLERAAR